MNISWGLDLRDNYGEVYEKCVLLFLEENTILKFVDAQELEDFANTILKSIPEIKENR